MSAYFHQFLLRRDNLSELDSANPILSSGEPTIALDKNILKIGDGEHRWQDLPSFISSRELKHKSIAVTIPPIEINDSYILHVSFDDINNNNKYAVLASPSTDLPQGIVISHGYVSGNNTVAIKFTNTSIANLNAGNVNNPAINSSTSYSGIINIIVYMTNEAVVAPVIITTPPPVRDSFYSFGYNNFGQLGLSDIKDRTRPTYAGLPVSGNPDNLWSDVSLGYYHTLAISKSGDLFSFGYNYYGQLGNGEFGIGKNIRMPTLIDSGINWTKVEAGAYHSLAIGDGKLFAFGSNAHGSLGLGDTNLRKDITGLNTEYIYENLQTQASGKIINSKLLLNYDAGDAYVENKLYTLPVGSSIVISLDAGYYVAVLNRNRTNLIAYSGVPNDPLTSSLAKDVVGTTNDGEYVFYNGNVSITALGNYDKASLYFYHIATDTFSYYGAKDLLRSENDTGWTNISAGHYHSLGIKNGYLYTWGNNAFGQLGVGDNIDRYEPTLVSQDNTWIDVAAGSYHSLAIKNNGGTYQLYTFGKNDHGQLGLNSSLPQIKIPTLVNASFNEVSLYNTETLQSGSQINVENLNYVFNYSNGKTYDVDDKYVLSEGTYIISGVPSNHPIAFLNAGKTNLFTYFGQNNAGTKVIDGNQYTFYHGNVTINVYGNFDAMSAYGLFYGYMGAKDVFLYNNSNASPANIDAGIDFSIVRTNLDEVWTFGKNNLGQLGLGDYNRRIKPHKIKEYDWTHAKAGANHALLLDSSKRMWSFGDNTHGQLGLGDNFSRNEPTVVNALERYDDITAGGNHSIGAIFSAAPTTPIITNVLTANDTNDIYDRNLKIVWEDVLSEQYGVTDYVVESGVSADGPWVVYGDTLTDDKFVTISGATVNTNYFFRVKSRNEEGFSDYSNIASGIPERLIDDLYCSTMLLLHFDTNFNSLSRFTSTYTGINGPTLNTNNAAFGNSYYDNGSTKQLQYFNNQDFNIPNDLCVEFYLKTSGVTSENVVRSIIQGNNFTTASVSDEGNSFAILSSGQNIIVAEKQNSTVRTLFTYTIPSNKQSDWNHFAWVRDDLTHKLFFNGVQVSGITQTSVLSYTQNTIRIAGNNTNSNNGVYTSFGMKGWIDELRITKQSRYTQSFSTDLFKRPFGEVAAENCGAGFGGIPLEFDSAYSWNYDLGSQSPALGQVIFNSSAWGGLYTVTTNVVSGDTVGLSSYYYPYITTTYVESYLDSVSPNSIVPYSGIATTGSGTQSSPMRATGDYSTSDRIFSINRSGLLTLRVNVNNGSSDFDYSFYLIKNGLPSYTQSGIVVDFDKYFVSGVGSVVDPMHVKIGRNFFFNQPREENRVWIKINVDGYLDIDTVKYSNRDGLGLYVSKKEPSQHLQWLSYRAVDGINNTVTTDRIYGYLPIVELGRFGANEREKIYTYSSSSEFAYLQLPNNADIPNYLGASNKIHSRYDNIPIKKGDYIICQLTSEQNLLSGSCTNSGEFVFTVREANNLLDINFENNLTDRSSFDHAIERTHSDSYNLTFDTDSQEGNYSLKFPSGTPNNPIEFTSNADYRFPVSVDLPANYLGIHENFTIETFFKFDNTFIPNAVEYHRIFAIERPTNGASSSFSQYFIYGKRDYLNFTIQTSGSAVVGAQLALNAESMSSDGSILRFNSSNLYDPDKMFIYGLKDDDDNVLFKLDIPSNKLNVSTTNWNHVALVKYHEMVVLFINGKPVSSSVIGKRKAFETYNNKYVFNNLKSWGGVYESENIQVSSGDIIGLESSSSAIVTSSVRAFYTSPQINARMIEGASGLTISGSGNNGSYPAIATGNHANRTNIFKFNHSGIIEFRADVNAGTSATNQDLVFLKNGKRNRAISIDIQDLEIPSRLELRDSYQGVKPSYNMGAPLTIGPLRGKMDLFKISADAKYLTPFDSELVVSRNDEYFNYDGRKYKKKDTYIYNVYMLKSDESLTFGNNVFEQIESENRYVSALLKPTGITRKIRFSVASYKPEVKIKINRTNKNKKYNKNFAAEFLLKLITSSTPTINSCMSVSNSEDGYVIDGEASYGRNTTRHTCINLDLLIPSGSMYYQDYEIDLLSDNPLASPYEYLNMEIIHDEDDITPARPSVARNLSATSGYGSVNLLWNSPSDFGGEKLSGYIVTSSLSGTNNTSYTQIPKTNQFQFSNLSQGSGYLFSIAPYNVIGSGDFSEQILVYPLNYGVPNAPQNLNTYTTSGAMVINWDAPADSGGRAITSYNIYYTDSGGISNTLSTSGNRTILSQLSNNTQHNVSVAAVNSIGIGNSSPIIPSVVRPKIISMCGENNNGQLGTGNTTDVNLFSSISGTFNNNWIDIYAGTNNSCAIDASGRLFIWGDNSRGQIGDGTTSNRLTATQPLHPIGASGIKWKKAATCGYSTYAISESGILYGVGAGGRGQFGLGSVDEYYETTRFIQTGLGSTFGKNDWVDIKPGEECLLALDKKGDIYFAGLESASWTSESNELTIMQIENDIAQAGYLKWKYINTSLGDRTFFLAIDQYDRLFIIQRYIGLKYFKAIGIQNCVAAAGWRNYNYGNVIYAVNNSGQLYACGANPYGLLGSGITSGGIQHNVLYSQGPTLVQTVGSPANIIDISATEMGLLCLTGSGEIWCIGYNNDGVFGRGNVNINAANTSFVKSSGSLFYDKMSSNYASSVITLGY
jgi:alpha-tubulin suppressor-like RCC1 family protein